MRRTFRAQRPDAPQPISKIDIRPIALFIAILAVIALIWNLGQRQTHTLLIDLPAGYPPPTAVEFLPPHAIVEVSAAGQILFDGQPVTLDQIPQAIRNSGMDYPTILFRPDEDAPYGTAALVLDALVDAGVARSEICFDQLAQHRRFDRIALTPAIASSPGVPQITNWTYNSDIAPTGCSYFSERFTPIV